MLHLNKVVRIRSSVMSFFGFKVSIFQVLAIELLAISIKTCRICKSTMSMSDMQPFKIRILNVVRVFLNISSVLSVLFPIFILLDETEGLKYISLDSEFFRAVALVALMVCISLAVVATLNYLIFGSFRLWNRLVQGQTDV